MSCWPASVWNCRQHCITCMCSKHAKNMRTAVFCLPLGPGTSCMLLQCCVLHRVFDGPSCAVCLGDYESSEMIRQLPDCHHHFHMECIDQWLATHTTCPMCRRSLLPPVEAAATPASPSASPTARLLPLWSGNAAGLEELGVELRQVTSPPSLNPCHLLFSAAGCEPDLTGTNAVLRHLLHLE